MAYKFSCSICKSDIYVNFLQTGAIVKCDWCGTGNIIPQDAEFVDQMNGEGDALVLQRSPFCPDTLQGILEESFRFFEKDFVRIIGIVALLILPVWLATTFLLIPYAISIGLSESAALYSTVFYVLFTFLTFWICHPLITGAMVYAMACHYLNKRPGILDSYVVVLKRYFRMLVTMLFVYFICALLAFTLIGIPFAIYLIYLWMVFEQVIVLENKSIIDSLKRSAYLIRGDWWRAFGYMLLTGLACGIIALILSFIPVFGDLIALFLTWPIGIIVMTLFYFNLRVKKDKFSLKELAVELERLESSH